MGKVLVIAEKPSAGADIAKVLGCSERKNGYIESNSYIVTWAVGHLIGLKMPEEHDEKLREWRLESLPLIFDIKDSLKVLSDTSEQFEIIRKLIHRKDVDYIINAGDAGREGYLIQSWIYRYAGNTKPVKILWASSLTDEALKKAFGNLKEEDIFFINLLQEAEARAEADYMMGMNYSRAITLTKSRDITLSYGRCQTPLLNMIVQRDIEIENFVSKPYFQLQVAYRQKFKGICVGTDNKPLNFNQQEEAEKLLNVCKGKKAEVISCEKEAKKKKAPLLFNLAELQKEMGRKFKYTPDQTLELTQRLYETYKIVSYPRTDSCHLSMDLYNEIGDHIQSCRFGKFKAVVDKIDVTDLKADKSYFNDAKVTDHHALIPTINDGMEESYIKLNEKERNVFEAIVYRFLAIFYPPYEYATTTLTVEIGEARFLSRGIGIKTMGYKELVKGEDKEDNEQIPMLEQGSVIDVEEISLLSKKTAPPPRYTIDSIITLMEQHHIGTSATMAEIIKKLQNPKRQSIVLEKGAYHSTPFGRKYISIVPEDLKSPNLTKNIEEKLALIGEGKLTKEAFLNEIIHQICSYIDSVKGEAGEIIERPPIGKCPFCKTPVKESRFSFQCSTPDCFNISKIICEKAITSRMVSDILEKGKTGLIKGFKSKTGKSFDAKLVYKDKKIIFEFPQQHHRQG